MEDLRVKKSVRSFLGFEDSTNLFIHKLVSDKEVTNLTTQIGTNPKLKQDNIAHVLAMTDNSIVYHINNNVYYIPAKATPKNMAVVDNGGEKPLVFITFTYPCEMREIDLEQF